MVKRHRWEGLLLGLCLAGSVQADTACQVLARTMASAAEARDRGVSLLAMRLVTRAQFPPGSKVASVMEDLLTVVYARPEATPAQMQAFTAKVCVRDQLLP